MQEQTRNIIRFKDLEKKIGKTSRSSVDRWEKAEKFPQRISLGANSMGWYEDEIDEWIKNREKRISINREMTPEQTFNLLPRKLQKHLLDLKNIPGALDRFLEYAKLNYEENKK